MPVELNPLALAIAVGLGWLLKNKWKSFNNQFIPLANFAVLFLGKLLLEASPAEAGVFSFLGHVGLSVADLAYQSAAEAVIASGAQSSAKATGRAALKLLRLNLLAKIVALAEKAAEK